MTACAEKARDAIWHNEHFCDRAKSHDGDHECLCGHSWPRTTVPSE